MARHIFFAASIFLFLSLYNIRQQYSFNGDSARDTLASYRLLKSKDITLIGPPLSIGLNGSRETYFSSVTYYLGAFSLALGNNSPYAPLIPMIFINLSAFLPLYYLLKKYIANKKIILMGLLLYATNPIIITYSRLFWNPTPLIGLGLWSMYFISYEKLFFAGLTLGIMVHFHYISIILMPLSLWHLIVQRQKVSTFLLGYIIPLLPFAVFEIKNKGYLVQSLFYNITHTTHGESTFFDKLEFAALLPIHIWGLTQDFFGHRLLVMPQWLAVILGIVIWIMLIRRSKNLQMSTIALIILSIGALVSDGYIRSQYLFPGIGLFLIVCIMSLRKYPVLLTILIVIQVLQSWNIIQGSSKIYVDKPFPTISALQSFADTIRNNAQGKFNITENIVYDSRALYLRYFLEKAHTRNLQNELSYSNLDELYILTPSLQHTMENLNWETNASGLIYKDTIATNEGFIVLRFEK